MEKNNLYLEGGKIYGKGSYGYVIDINNIYNIPNDKEILVDKLSNYLKKNINVKIKGYNINDGKPILLDGNQVLMILKTTKNLLAKTYFVNKPFLDELNETVLVYKIFNENLNNLVLKNPTDNMSEQMSNIIYYNNYFVNNKNKISSTIIPLKINNDEIIAITFDDNYYLFTEKCDKVLKNFKIGYKISNQDNSFPLVKLIDDIINVIAYLQLNKIAHGDIHSGNIILCENKFKLIDWGMAVNTDKYNPNLTYRLSTHSSSPAILLLSESKKNNIYNFIFKFFKPKINSEARSLDPQVLNFLLKNPDFLVRYHLDMYTFALTLTQIDLDNLYSKDIKFKKLVNYIKNIKDFSYRIDYINKLASETDLYLIQI